MKEEAIRALELFKQQHLAKPAVEVINEQDDMVSVSSQPTKENHMDQTTELKQKSFNYPDHIVPLKQRIMSALNNGARSVESVARYCKEDEKLINLQLNRWVSRGIIGKQITPSSGMVRYYPHEIAKEMGILTDPKPIAKRRTKAQMAQAKQPRNIDPTPLYIKPQVTQEAQYIQFLENRITEWQAEARKMAKQISDLEAEVIKAKTEPRNVTGEVQEVMKEVMELRSTVAYLESKLFGRK